MLAEIRSLNEECGVVGVWGHPDAAQLAYYGLHSLQHRGQEGAGIVVTDGEQMSISKGEGLVTEIFTAEKCRHFPVAVKRQSAMSVIQRQAAAGIKMFSLSCSIRIQEGWPLPIMGISSMPIN